MIANTTFRELERRYRIDKMRGDGESSLERWYQSRRDTPIGSFSDGDICRAVRQTLYLEQIVPVAISRLEKSPRAGDLYDGELIVALSSLPRKFWLDNPSAAETLRNVLAAAPTSTEVGDVSDAIYRLNDHLTR